MEIKRKIRQIGTTLYIPVPKDMATFLGFEKNTSIVLKDTIIGSLDISKEENNVPNPQSSE